MTWYKYTVKKAQYFICTRALNKIVTSSIGTMTIVLSTPQGMTIVIITGRAKFFFNLNCKMSCCSYICPDICSLTTHRKFVVISNDCVLT